jgi:hypothetical protein
MDSILIWWSCVSIEVILLVRGALGGLLRKYPFFYAYIGCVLLREIVGLLSYRFGADVYAGLYWPGELVTITASYAVIVEIFRQSLNRNAVVARIAQSLLIAVFAGALIYAASDLLHGKASSLPRTIAQLARDLRYMQGAPLLVMLWLFLRCRVLIERHLLGLTLGYSFWVGVNAMNLAIWLHPGNEYSSLLIKSQPITYLITLVIWCVTLWSSQPDPVPRPENPTAQTYEPLLGKTRAAFAALSASVTRTPRP